MGKSRRKTSTDVLRYSREGRSQATVRAHYLRWRQEQKPPMPLRCDNPVCHFYANPLIWNGEPLKPILDHVDGNSSDNRPQKLRLLCPNCDSQLATRGGGNRGRIEKSEGGFATFSRETGKRHYTLIADDGRFSISVNTNDECGSGHNGGAQANRKAAEQIDVADCQFQNVIVGGGIIAVNGILWKVPDGASHVAGRDEKVSMTLVCGNW